MQFARMCRRYQNRKPDPEAGFNVFVSSMDRRLETVLVGFEGIRNISE